MACKSYVCAGDGSGFGDDYIEGMDAELKRTTKKKSKGVRSCNTFYTVVKLPRDSTLQHALGRSLLRPQPITPPSKTIRPYDRAG